MSGLREVPRVVWVLAASRFTGSLTSFLMLFLTLYLTSDARGLSGPVAGLLTGTYGVGLLVGNLTGGRWGDRLGHRRVLLAASTGAGLATAAVPWLPTPALVLALPLGAYLSATAGVSAGALTALSVPRGDRRTAVAIGRAASNAGFVIGPPLGALLAAWSYSALFVVDGAMTLAVRFAVAAVLARDDRTAPEPGPGGPAPSRDGDRGPGLLASLRRDRPLQVLLVGVVLVDLVYRQLYTTLPLHLRDAGEPVGLYAATIGLGSGLILALEIPVALRLRGRPAVPIVAAGYALVGLGFLGFSLPVGVVTTLGAMVVVTAGEILYKTTATAHVLDAAPDRLVGGYQGLYTGASTSGTLLAGPLGTLVYAAAPGVLWPLCAVVGVGAGAVALGSGRLGGRAVRPARRTPAGTR